MGRSVDDLLREQDWAKVSARVLAYALSRTRSRAKASDVAQEAMMRALDARWNPWDPEKDPDIVTFLIKIVNRLLTNENQGRKRHREIAMDRELSGEGASDDNPAGATIRSALGGGTPSAAGPKKAALAAGAPTAEEALGERDLFARRMASLRERLAGDRIALDTLDQTELGVDDPEEQAEATGHPLHEIHKARRRRAFHAEKVAREISGDITPGTGPARRGDDL